MNAEVVFDHTFDPELFKEIQTIRTLRLSLAEKQLHNLSYTMAEIKNRGLTPSKDENFNEDSLREALMLKIKELKQRQKDTKRIYADEIEFYLSLISKDSE